MPWRKCDGGNDVDERKRTGAHGPTCVSLRTTAPASPSRVGRRRQLRRLGFGRRLRGSASSPPPGETRGKPFQRFCGTHESLGNLVGIGPRRWIEPFGERRQCLQSRGVGRALRNPLAHDGIPVIQNAICSSGVAPWRLAGSTDAAEPELPRGSGSPAGGCGCGGSGRARPPHVRASAVGAARTSISTSC